MRFAEILINRKVDSLDHSFTYEIPPDLSGEVKVGSFVQVPFGHGTVKGIVINLMAETEIEETKNIDALLHGEIIFPEELLNLAHFIAAYYMNHTMSVLRAMLPSGVNIFGKMQGAKKENFLALVPIPLNEPLSGPKQKALYDLLSQEGALRQREVMEIHGIGLSTIHGLAKKNILTIEAREVFRKPQALLPRHTAAPKLTWEQQGVLAEIRRLREDGKPFLLQGVTGSGKTEVYLKLIEENLAAGKEAIVLIPEIALTPQFIGIFEDRFAGKIVVMHSRLSTGQRRDAWHRINRGEAQIVIGARSAIFAPCRNLGLIIMDEEHEQSYYQENSPRFHCREVAVKRGENTGALMLMASATPDIESYHKALAGKYYLLEMESRIGGRPLPAVEIVDMRKELREGWTQIFSRPLVAAVKDRLQKGEQSLIFLNRLGSHTFVSCRDCGFVYQCPHCSVSLVYYKQRHSLRCHHCGYELPMAETCPQCESKRIRYFGLGTEELESVVRKTFPGARIARLDSDNTRQKGRFEAVYEAMHRGDVDILIGTKMIAKGWDFPNITLAGIVAADMTLNFPDFRAAEWTFQLITQVSGRCGRGDRPGLVVLQTYRPEEPAVRLGGAQDYRRFYEWEIANREQYRYPPFRHLAKITLSGERGNLPLPLLERIAIILREKSGLPVYGPGPAPIHVLKDAERWLYTMSGEDLAQMRAALKAGLTAIRKEKLIGKGIHLQVEIAPMRLF